MNSFDDPDDPSITNLINIRNTLTEHMPDGARQNLNKKIADLTARNFDDPDDQALIFALTNAAVQTGVGRNIGIAMKTKKYDQAFQNEYNPAQFLVLRED